MTADRLPDRWLSPLRDGDRLGGSGAIKRRVRIGRVARAAWIALIVLALGLLVAAPAVGADLEKAISLSGPQPLRSDDNPNDYRLWGNRAYFKESRTSWVKFWVSWYDIQQGYQPASLADSWQQLDASANLRRLDAQVRAANEDGVHVIVTIYQAFPTWASGADGPDPLSSKPAIQKLPLDLSPDGPWGWFVGHLLARYDGSTNAIGPSAFAPYGNPDAAKIDALEVVNEPNTLCWPQDDIAQNTATMLRTAAALSERYGHQTILGPATSDYPDPGGAKAGVTTDWKAFTTAMLDALAGWQPPVPVYWSQHNYRDVKYEDPAATSRAKQVIDLLAAKGWRSPQLWLTEGGLNLGSNWTDPVLRDAQAAKIADSFEQMRLLPEVVVWTQHGLNDVPENNFKSGFRDDFDYPLPGPGAQRPAWAAWETLDGARQPAPTAPAEPVAPGAGDTATANTVLTSDSEAAPIASAATAVGASAVAASAPPSLVPPAVANDLAPAAVDNDPLQLLSAEPAAAACTVTGPSRFAVFIFVDRRHRLTLPRTRVTADGVPCTGSITLMLARTRVMARIRVAAGGSSAVRMTLPASALAALPRRATLALALHAVGQPATHRTWRLRVS